MKSYVLDASIILSYLFDESGTIKILVSKLLNQAQKKQVRLLSTSFLPVEVANGLRFKLKDSATAKQILFMSLNLPIDYYQLTSPQLLQATELSYLNNTTIYDTSYHVLAIAHDASFITCDKKYYKQAKGLEHIELYA